MSQEHDVDAEPTSRRRGARPPVWWLLGALVLGAMIGTGVSLLMAERSDSATEEQALSDRDLACAALANVPEDFEQQLAEEDVSADEPALYRLVAVSQLGQAAQLSDEQTNADIGDAAQQLDDAWRSLPPEPETIGQAATALRDACR